MNKGRERMVFAVVIARFAQEMQKVCHQLSPD
jgi:hypothetical protein